MVTTIGDLGLRTNLAPGFGSSRSSMGLSQLVKAARRMRRWDDGINGMMGIDGEGDINPNTLILPETVITPGPDFDPDPSPAPATSTSSASNPPPAKPSKAAWARGDGSYILQSGDTLWGLATTYLASGPRWREIWNEQTAAYKASRTPDKIFAGDLIAMPTAAQGKARAMGLFGIGASVIGRGFSVKQIAIAAAGVVGVGSGIYFLNR